MGRECRVIRFTTPETERGTSAATGAPRNGERKDTQRQQEEEEGEEAEEYNNRDRVSFVEAEREEGGIVLQLSYDGFLRFVRL